MSEKEGYVREIGKDDEGLDDYRVMEGDWEGGVERERERERGIGRGGRGREGEGKREREE